MPVTYTKAPEVRDIADKLIAEHHTHLIDNGHVRIEYIFRSEAAQANGKTVFGKARKISGLNAFLSSVEEKPEAEQVRTNKGRIVLNVDEWEESESYFVVEIAADVWGVLDRKQKTALVDHELCHLQVAADGKLALRPHDVEAFAAEVHRHGLWQEDLQKFIRALSGKQLSLLKEEEGDE